jgi:hypothetical protein
MRAAPSADCLTASSRSFRACTGITATSTGCGAARPRRANQLPRPAYAIRPAGEPWRSAPSPPLQLYTAESLNGSLVGKSGRPYRRFGGLCLECEGYPGPANTAGFGDIFTRPGQPRRQTTVYSFSQHQ